MKKFINITKKYLLTALIFYLLFLILKYPSASSQGIKEMLIICGNVLIPSIFAFMVLSKIISSSGIVNFSNSKPAHYFCRIFKLPGKVFSLILLSFLGGYPTGIINAVTLYENKIINKTQCYRLTSFANNCSPGFMIIFVGVNLLGNYKYGIILFAIHIISALLCGFIFSNFVIKEEKFERLNTNFSKSNLPVIDLACICKSVKSSTLIMIEVCAYLVLFGAVLYSFFESNIFIYFLRLFPESLREIVQGLFYSFCEISKGVLQIANFKINDVLKISFISLASGFGGLCVFMQGASVLSEKNLKSGYHFSSKICQGLISFSLTFLTFSIINKFETVSVLSSLSKPADTANVVFSPVIWIFISLLIAFSVLYIIVSYTFLKKYDHVYMSEFIDRGRFY